MIDTLVFSFTRKLAKEKNLDRIVWLYKQTAEKAKQFYKVKLFTDTESSRLFENTDYDDLTLIETDSIILLDDMKLSVLRYLNHNELLIDGDIYLREKLCLEQDCDILCEAGYDRLYSPQSILTLNYYLSLGIQDIIPFFDDKCNIVPNIGILYFKSRDLENEYLDWYAIFKKWIIQNSLHEIRYTDKGRINPPSAQGLLGAFAREKGKTIKYTRGLSNYTHYQLDIKYKENFKIER